MERCDAVYKGVMIGDSGVGKTALLMRFCERVFEDNYVSTIGVDVKKRVLNVDGHKVKLQLWDTAGQERFRTITQSYYRGADGIVIVFDLTDMESFTNVKHWVKDINRTNDSSTKILVGNKLDLNREVSKDVATAYASKMGFRYFETSAKSGSNVDSTFLEFARILLGSLPADNPSHIQSTAQPINGKNTSSGSCC